MLTHHTVARGHRSELAHHRTQLCLCWPTMDQCSGAMQTIYALLSHKADAREHLHAEYIVGLDSVFADHPLVKKVDKC